MKVSVTLTIRPKFWNDFDLFLLFSIIFLMQPIVNVSFVNITQRIVFGFCDKEVYGEFLEWTFERYSEFMKILGIYHVHNTHEFKIMK